MDLYKNSQSLSLDADIALFGTGIAPLIAAHSFIEQGKSVLLINPDSDFFLEDSELPFDPLFGDLHSLRNIDSSIPEEALKSLKPYFPGSIEFWSPQIKFTGFHDTTAPHVRSRGRLWPTSKAHHQKFLWKLDKVEDFYIEASDLNFHPQMLEGLAVGHKFPGFQTSSSHIHSTNLKGLYLPKVCDVDVLRYRIGILEFIKEKIEHHKTIFQASQLETMPQGIRFHAQGVVRNAQLKNGLMVFWTPRLSHWILNQMKRSEFNIPLPQGIQLWEEWLLNSNQILDPNSIAFLPNMAIWSSFQGIPSTQAHHNYLAVLKKGPLISLKEYPLTDKINWASADSFQNLSELIYHFLNWDSFSVRNLKTRMTLIWPQTTSSTRLTTILNPELHIVSGCDGFLVDIIRNTKQACDKILKNRS